ncbi:MFS transporter [Epidermidibacterium keratini]|uniref:MFS transporter n=1 Tax=Epidermidibacterium keratini TaxID=1891644 RepID=A0A7L4YNT6_9ACTN|nr:MFS transporter [Epidermidibacterium keratini]QHC00469.1 MFS transporter [Epidermidibacterium keratini]
MSETGVNAAIVDRSHNTPVPWPAVSVLLAGLFMATLDSYIVIVAAPTIQQDLHAAPSDVQWVLASYQLSYAVALITAGRIGDIVGRRRVFTLGVVLFTLASVLCALSPSVAGLIAARVAQGLGAALIVPQVYAVVSLVVPGVARSRVFGVVGVVLAMATIGGQLLGGVLVGADVLGTSWRPIFAVNLPIGIALLIFTRRVVPELRASAVHRLDLYGAVVLSMAVLSLTYPLVQGPELGWPRWVIVLFALSVLLLGGFVAVEAAVDRRGGDPLLRLRLFAAPTFTLGLLLVVALYAVITSYYLALSVSLQDGLGLSALDAGLVYVPAAGMFFASSLLAGRLVPRYGTPVLLIGGAILSIGYAAAGLVLVTVQEMSIAVLVPLLMVQSVGGGLVITPALNVVLAGVAPDDTGMASGLLSTAQQIGAALGVAVIGGLFFADFDPELGSARHAAAHGFATASFAACAIAALATALICAIAREPSRRDRSQ